ncbi:MAG: N-acetyltransferase family protein [Actinomycetota bacterium]
MDLDIALDPPIDDRLANELITIWVDVSNADGAVGFVPPVSEADVRARAELVFEEIREDRTHLVTGRLDGKLVGFCFLEQRIGPLFAHWATVKRIQVHPSLQGRGLGSQLLDRAGDLAIELGLDALHLTVRGGTGRESFNERHGYRIVGRIPKTIRVGPGDDREEIYMVKELV